MKIIEYLSSLLHRKSQQPVTSHTAINQGKQPLTTRTVQEANRLQIECSRNNYSETSVTTYHDYVSQHRRELRGTEHIQASQKFYNIFVKARKKS